MTSDEVVAYLTFDEVVAYLQGLVGHRIEAWTLPRRGEGPDFRVGGVVAAVTRVPVGRASPPKGWRCVLQVGEEEGNGFALSSVSFLRAGLDVVEAWPTRYALFIVLEGDSSIVIEDERIYWQDGGPRLPE